MITASRTFHQSEKFGERKQQNLPLFLNKYQIVLHFIVRPTDIDRVLGESKLEAIQTNGVVYTYYPLPEVIKAFAKTYKEP